MTGGKSVSVPVKRDGRTFAERRRDMFNRLQKQTQKHAQSAKTSTGVVPYSRNWFDDVNRWANAMERTWSYDVQQMWNDMFSLMPTDLFDVPTQSLFTPLGDVPSVLDRMDRQLKAMRQQMNQAGIAANEDALANLITEKPLDYLRNAYEVGEDGRVQFKLRFDVRGYDPDDIHVTKSDHAINVHAKHTTETDSSSCKREFSRMVYLPDSVDADKFECHLTKDGALTLEAPVKATPEPSLTFDREQQLSVKPSEALQKQVTPADKQLALKPTGVIGASVHGNKLHVEVPVQPGFGAEDLCVRMDKNRVIVSGKKTCHEETGTSKTVCVNEFTNSYEVPETVDPVLLQSQLHGNILVVEAPLLTPSTSK